MIYRFSPDPLALFLFFLPTAVPRQARDVAAPRSARRDRLPMP